MKIYLASTGPNNEVQRERGMLPITRRLLSYYAIINPKLPFNDSGKVFQAIRKEKEENE